MKPSPGTARILIASDNADDATQIQRQLKSDFEHVRTSTVAERGDGLYRMGQSLLQHAHRTVILCSKDEVRDAFELCKKEYFDDYVLYWPHTHDGPRLAMSIWSACREMMALRSDEPGPAQLLAHARHLADLERTLSAELAEGEQQIAVARHALAQAEGEAAGAFDDFSRRVIHGTELKDMAALAREIDQLKQQQLAQTRRVGIDSLEPMRRWAHKLKAQIEPALAGTRALAEQVRKIRLIVMVVEDDELMQKLVLRTLDPALYEILSAGDGTAAFSLLRRVRPDVILMDISLPGMDGVALTQRLKATPHLADIPVIMMTGDARRETLISSMEGGAAAFVVKPFTRESLTAKLDRILPR